MQYSMKPDQIQKIETPVYVASAKDDVVVNELTHERMDDTNPLIKIVPYPGARHEIYTEINLHRNRFLKEIDAFFMES